MPKHSLKPVGRPRKNLPPDMKRDYRPPHLEHYIGVKANAICERRKMKPEELWKEAFHLMVIADNNYQEALEKQKEGDKMLKELVDAGKRTAEEAHAKRKIILSR